MLGGGLNCSYFRQRWINQDGSGDRKWERMPATKNPSGGDAPSNLASQSLSMMSTGTGMGAPRVPLPSQIPNNPPKVKLKTLCWNNASYQFSHSEAQNQNLEAFQHVEVLNQVRSLPSARQPIWETVVAYFAENPFAERNQKETKVGTINFSLFW